MSLKIIKFEPRLERIVLIAVAILCLAAAWFFIKWDFANAIASRIDPERPESMLVADWLTQVAPGDPQTHSTAALLFEKTFDPGDWTRSLSEHELAAVLSPHNYLMWLNLGKARSQNGDMEGAEAAYARAQDLAPNYNSVQWVYGNFLIRQGRTGEGFALIAKAAATKAEYSAAAVVTALQISDGDPGQVRQMLGDTDVTNTGLATALAGQTRSDEAFEAWSKVTAADKTGKFKKLGETLAGQMVAANKFQLASRIAADLQVNDTEKPSIGLIVNGGFENGVKLRDAGLFEWQIGEGAMPQIGLSDGQKRSGKYSLWMLFNTFETAGFRPVSQTVPVVPGAEYEFEVFYMSDLKSSAKLKWEIADAATTTAIANTEPFAAAAAWTPLRVRFTVPARSDGVVIRLAREGCAGPSCPMNGKLSFDDISIRRL